MQSTTVKSKTLRSKAVRSHTIFWLSLLTTTFLSIPTLPAAVITINDGQTLRQVDLEAESFNGQTFALGPETTFNVLSGASMGPIEGTSTTITLPPVAGGGSFTIRSPFRLEGSAVNLAAGSSLATNTGLNYLSEMNLSVFDGAVIGPRLSIEESEVNVFGGSIGRSFTIGRDSVANIYGGTFGDELITSGRRSTTNIFAGTFSSRFRVDDSTVNIYGGDFSSIRIESRNPVSISGGVFESVANIYPSTTVVIAGGSFESGIRLAHASNLYLSVTELLIDGVPVDLEFGEQLLITQRNQELLEAKLADGSYMDIELTNLGDGTFTSDVISIDANLYVVRVVPEVSSTSLMLVGTLLAPLARRRRNSRC